MEKISNKAITKIILKKNTRIKRKLPENSHCLSDRWKKIFSNLAYQDQPSVEFLSMENVNIDSRAVIWDGFTKDFFLDHHEYSEKRVLYQSIARIPEIKEMLRHPKGSLKKIIKYIFFKNDVKELPTDRPVLLFWDSRCTNNLFHWLIDALARLTLLSPCNRKPYLLLPREAIKRDYVLFTLEKFGFCMDDIILIDPNIKYKCRELNIITTSILASGACSTSLVEQIQLKLVNPSASINRKFYFARKRGTGREIVNNSEFELLLEEYGFEKIYPEDYDFSELVDLLAETEILIAIYSASLAHAVLMPRGSTIVEVASENFISATPSYWGDNYTSKISGDYYYTLARACGLKYSLVPCKQKKPNEFVLSADIYVDIDQLKETIKFVIT